MLESFINWIKAWAEGVILALGTPGIGILMLLDSANIPIPSEVIMPFGGMMAAEGKLAFHAVALAGTIGNGPLQPAGLIRRSAGLRALRHVKTRSLPGFQITHRDQPVEGLDHGELADPMRVREMPDRRQARARPQGALVDALLDAGHDLLDQGPAVVGIEVEGMHDCYGSMADTV